MFRTGPSTGLHVGHTITAVLPALYCRREMLLFTDYSRTNIIPAYLFLFFYFGVFSFSSLCLKKKHTHTFNLIMFSHKNINKNKIFDHMMFSMTEFADLK